MNPFELTKSERKQLVKMMRKHKDETEDELFEYLDTKSAREQRALFIHYSNNPPRKREREIRRT